MPVSVSETINASRDTVWQVITDIDNAQHTISAITDLEILERPVHGLVGLKWQETRVMFGKEATETMWITEAEDGYWYQTEAHNHGMIYHSKLDLNELNDKTVLTMSFDCLPQTSIAKVFNLISFLFAGTVKKAFITDLCDIKARAESL